MTPRRIRQARVKGQWRYRSATATWSAASSGRPMFIDVWTPHHASEAARAAAAAISAALADPEDAA